jgi:hypothetical protein
MAQYQKAIAEFKLAYDEEPRPEILYSWAQTERLSGNCRGAVDLYRRFLAGNPPKEHAEAARLNIVRCGESVEPTAAPAAATTIVVAPPPPRRPWYKDIAGGVLSGVGVAGLALGTGFFVGSNSEDDAATNAVTYGDHAHHTELAQSYRIVGITGLAAGGVLLAIGIGRYIYVGVKR